MAAPGSSRTETISEMAAVIVIVPRPTEDNTIIGNVRVRLCRGGTLHPVDPLFQPPHPSSWQAPSVSQAEPEHEHRVKPFRTC